MNIVKAFEQHCFDNHYAPLTGTEQTALDAFVVWLVQNGLLSTLETHPGVQLRAQPCVRGQRVWGSATD